MPLDTLLDKCQHTIVYNELLFEGNIPIKIAAGERLIKIRKTLVFYIKGTLKQKVQCVLY